MKSEAGTMTEGAPAVVGHTCTWDGARWLRAVTHPYGLMRREFHLGSDASGAMLCIHGNMFYRVWLNGRFVGDGPRRGTPATYRTYQLEGWLQAGANVLAVEIYHPEDNARLIAHLTAEDGNVTLVSSDSCWRGTEGTMWQTDVPNSTLRSPIEVCDLREEPTGWREIGFDDCDWRQIEAMEDPTPGELVPDPALPEKRTLARAVNVVRMAEAVDICSGEDPADNVALRLAYEPWEDCRMHTVESPAGFLEPEQGPVTIEAKWSPTVEGYYAFLEDGSAVGAERCPTVVLDFGRLINGHVCLDIEAPGGTQVDIGFAQVLIGGRLPTVLYAGDRRWGNKADRVVLRNGRQIWESFHWEQTRYLQLTFRRHTGPIRIHGVWLVARDADLPIRGSFACSDPELNALWEATIRTMQVTTADVFTDNCIREKLGFGGECGTRSLMTCWTAVGNPPLARHFIRQFTRKPEVGCFLSTTVDDAMACNDSDPGRANMFFHVLQFWYAMRVYRLYAEPDDYEADGVLAAYRTCIAYLADFCNDRGMLADTPGHAWLDWVPGRPDGGGYTWGCGEGAPQNLFYCLLLRGLSEAEAAVGNTKTAQALECQAELVADRIYTEFWNEARGLYVDALVDDKQLTCQFSEHSNALALLAGLGRQGRAEIIVKNLTERRVDLIRAEAMFTHFPAVAFAKTGRVDLMLACLRNRYGPMLRDLPNPTLWEERSYAMTVRSHCWQGRYRSLAQSSSAVPAYLLSTEVLGIKPTESGFASFSVHPQFADLAWARGSVPTPFGDVQVNWECQDDGFTLAITVPDGSRGTVHLPPAEYYSHEGQPIDSRRPTVTIGPGHHLFTGRTSAT
jgi:alpha-L-rhamnosidase